MYKNLVFEAPPSMFITATDTSRYLDLWKEKNDRSMQGGYPVNHSDIPQWVRHQRYSWHGVDFMYHGRRTFMDFYPDYLETLMGVDESIGRVVTYLRENDLLKNTVVFYMGDNGFSFGEHGLIDKRHAYEESMRVPLLVYAPSMIDRGMKVEQVVQNVDIAPTILDMAGVDKPDHFQGASFLPLLRKQQISWRDRAFYEYYWEYDFPQTPSMFAVRTNRYKYIYNYGIWDTNELYDLEADPYEMNNLIRKPEHAQKALEFRKEIFDWLEETGGLQIPLRPLGNQSRSDHIYKGRY
jgi:N-acetylglucosamine-6-sulfatase